MAGEDYTRQRNLDPAFPPWRIRDVGAIMIVCHAVVFGYRKLFEILFLTDVKLGVVGFSMQKLESFMVWAIFSQGILIYSLLLWLSARLIRRHGHSFAAIGWPLQLSPNLVAVGVCNRDGIWSCVFFLHPVDSGRSAAGVEIYGLCGGAGGVFGSFLCFLSHCFLSGRRIFFRGVSYHVFRKHVGAPAGIILSSLVFVVWHPPIIETPIMAAYIFVCGLIECTVFERLKSLVPAIVVHIMINLAILFSSHYL